MNRTVFLSLVTAFALAGPGMLNAQTSSAGPNIIPIGSPLMFGGTNAPDTYSASVTFSSTPVLVDNGAVKIWQKQVPTGPTGEWDVFYLQITNGGPLAGNINAYWNILMNYTLSAPVYFDQVVNQWLVNGTPVNPLTNGIGSICCATTSNPIIPGPAYYNSGFTTPLPAGVQTSWRQVYVTPYNIVSGGGVNPSTANEFIFALHFTLQGAVPTVTGAISASQFGAFPTFGPGSWIEIYGTNLGADTQGWGQQRFQRRTSANGPRWNLGDHRRPIGLCRLHQPDTSERAGAEWGSLRRATAGGHHRGRLQRAFHGQRRCGPTRAARSAHQFQHWRNPIRGRTVSRWRDVRASARRDCRASFATREAWRHDHAVRYRIWFGQSEYSAGPDC